MTILAIYKLLLYGGLAFIVGSLVALEVFLNWKYPLPPQPTRGRQADLDADRAQIDDAPSQLPSSARAS